MRLSRKLSVLVFVIFALVSFILILFIGKLQMKGTESLVPPNDPAIIAMKKMKKEFGSSDQIMVILKTPGIFDKNVAERAYKLIESLKKIKGVTSVQSIFDSAKVRFTFAGLSSNPYFKDGIPSSNATEVLKSPLYVGNLIDSSGHVLAVILNVSKNVVNEVRKVLSKNIPSGFKYFITGDDVVESSINSSTLLLALVYPPLLFGLIWLLYFLKLGNVLAAAIPPLISLLSAMWTYGIAGMIGLSLNILTSTVGIFVIVVSSSYGLHFIDRYMNNRDKMNHVKAAKKTLREEATPIFMSALTTAVGFATFIFVGIPAFKTLGELVAIGVGISALFSIILIPAVAEFFDLHKRLSHVLRFHVIPSSKFNKISMIVVLAIVAISPIFISRVQVNSDEFGYFKANSAVRKSSRVANEYFGWTLPLYVVVSKNSPFTSLDAKQFSSFIGEIKGIHGVNGVNSALDISKEFDVPFPILQILSHNPTYKPYFSEWFSKDSTRFLVKTPYTDTSSIKKIAEKIESFSQKLKGYNIYVASPALLTASMNSSIVTNQISTIIIAFLFIMLLLIIVFRSFYLSMIASVPIVLAVILNFFVMGIGHMYLEVSTAIVSSVLMGLVIDYSIHTITRYRITHNVNFVLEEVGPVIIDNTLGLMAGFGTLLFSPLLLYVRLGFLMSIGIGIGAFTTMVFVVELLRMYEKKVNKIISHENGE